MVSGLLKIPDAVCHFEHSSNVTGGSRRFLSSVACCSHKSTHARANQEQRGKTSLLSSHSLASWHHYDAKGKLDHFCGSRLAALNGFKICSSMEDDFPGEEENEGLDDENEDAEGEEDQEQVKNEDDMLDIISEVPSSSSAYLRAKDMLSSLSRGVARLETEFKNKHEDLGDSSKIIETILTSVNQQNSMLQGETLREAQEKVRKLELQVQQLQRDRASGELRMLELSRNYESAFKRLKEAEKEAERVQDLVSESGFESVEKQKLEKELSEAREQAESALEQVSAMENGLRERDALLQQLHEESALSSSALQQAAKAMVAARDRTLRLEEQLEQTGDLLNKERQLGAKARENFIKLQSDAAAARREKESFEAKLEQLAEEIVGKDILIEKLTEESERTRAMMELTNKALEESRKVIARLEAEVQQKDEQLRNEVEVSATAMKNAALKESALRGAETKVRELSAEVEALREEMTAQGEAMSAMKAETVKNARMLLQATQTRQDLDLARDQVVTLQTRVVSLEEELLHRDKFLDEIRSETRLGSEALSMAQRYKSELDSSREREAELADELESRETLVAELRRELTENIRAQRAEHALRVAERRAAELEAESALLRRGVKSRDEAMSDMRRELEESAAMLSQAKENRQALKELQEQVERMKAQIQARDEWIAASYTNQAELIQHSEEDIRAEELEEDILEGDVVGDDYNREEKAVERTFVRDSRPQNGSARRWRGRGGNNQRSLQRK